jgi:hypothetical protein
MKKIKVRSKTGGKVLSRTQSRYRFKDGFADRAKETARKQYRQKRGKEFELAGSVVLRSLEFLAESAETLPVTNTRTRGTALMPVIRLTELAKLLDTTYQTIWRWSSDTEQLPVPILTETTTGRERPVYHLEECRVMIQAIGEHMNEYRYYRKNHTAVRDRIFSEIETIRKSNFGVNTHGNQKEHGGKGGSVKVRPQVRAKGRSVVLKRG